MQISTLLSYLKKRPEFLTSDQIASALQVEKDLIESLLQEGVNRSWIVKFSPTPWVDVYKIAYNLLDPFPSECIRPNYVSYDLPIKNIQLPLEYMNPHVENLIKRNQGSRSICVGCAAAYGRDLDMMKYNVVPKVAEGQIRYITENVRGTSIIYDRYLHSSFSAECIYAWSREVGKISPDVSGSFISSAVDAMRLRGSVLEKDWYTPIYYGAEVFDPYPLGRDEILLLSGEHKIDGYVGIRDFDQIKSAIYQYGYVLMPILIYSNYADGNMEDFLEPNGKPIGSHALCWVGYSEDRLYCLHSWERWSKVGSISRSYWESSAGTAYTIIDYEERLSVAGNYAKMYLSSPIECEYVVNGVKIHTMPVVVPLQTPCIISAHPKLGGYKSKEVARTFTMAGDNYITFDFREQVILKPIVKSIEQAIQKIIFRRS